jgi:hypothetical protein
VTGSRVLGFALTLLLIDLVLAVRRHGIVAPKWIAQKTGFN